MTAHYDTDLAWIHHTGFSEFAESAAPGVLALLANHGVTEGTIVDSGCGSGVLARALVQAGFETIGFDASPAMIALARQTAPDASFFLSRFADARLPECDAIVMVGEVLNYGTWTEVAQFVATARSALRPGGVLLFDVAECGAYPAHDERRIGGDDWSVIVIKESDGRTLTRRVLTFREVDGHVRRSDETHVLELYDRRALVTLVRSADFRVHVRRSYGTRRLPKGHAVYVCVHKGGGRPARDLK